MSRAVASYADGIFFGGWGGREGEREIERRRKFENLLTSCLFVEKIVTLIFH
jgi:hypothetical protein